LLRYTNIQNWFGHSCAWGDHVRRNLQHDSAIARVFFWVQKKTPLEKGAVDKGKLLAEKTCLLKPLKNGALRKKTTIDKGQSWKGQPLKNGTLENGGGFGKHVRQRWRKTFQKTLCRTMV